MEHVTNMLSFSIILCFLMPCEGSAFARLSNTQDRIIHGSAIDIEKAPYQAQYEHVGIPVCGATIISPAYALTAAHCTVRSVVSLVTVRVGSSSRAHGGSIHDAVFIIRHERYSTNPVVDYDIAIVRVAAVFMYNARVQPIPMATAPPAAGTVGLVSGWGAAQAGGQPSATLRQTTAVVVDKAACNGTLAGRLSPAMLCAGDGADVCAHDMGGALVAEGQLAGIASWGAGCGQTGSPAVYADVAALRAWVHTNSGI